MIRVIHGNIIPEFHNLAGEHYASFNKAGDVLAWFGLAHQWDSVGRVYFRPAIDAYTIGDVKSMVKEIRKLLKERSPYYNRIEATVDMSSDVDWKFADRMNFVVEGNMRSYYQGEDHYMMRYSDG